MQWFGEPLDRKSLDLNWARAGEPEPRPGQAASLEPRPTGKCVVWAEWRHYHADNALDVPQVVLHNHTVVDTNLAAYLRGVRPGMRKPMVRSLAHDCVFEVWKSDPGRQTTWLDVCAAYSGRIQPFEERSAAIDLSQHAKPFDLAEQMARELESLGFGALQWGCGPSVWMAQVAARLGARFDAVEHPAEFLAPLSVDYLLPVAEDQRMRLRFLGYRRVREVAAIPESTLRKQFGPVARDILLAARGQLMDAVSAIYPALQIREVLCLSEPLADAIALEACLARMAQPLAQRLSGQQAGSLELWVDYESGHTERWLRQFKRPLWSVVGLVHTFRYLITQLPVREEGVVRLIAELGNLEQAQSRQKSLEVERNRSSAESSLASLEAALGSGVIKKGSEVQLDRRQMVLKEWRSAIGWD